MSLRTAVPTALNALPNPFFEGIYTALENLAQMLLLKEAPSNLPDSVSPHATPLQHPLFPS